ncbi:hypothetical protein PG990_015349 [Apiospora arundinis]
MAWTWNVNDESPDNGANLTAMAVVFSTASLLSVLSRAYVRFYLLNAVGAGKTTQKQIYLLLRLAL